MKNKLKIIAVVGPTASGKSILAIAIAKNIGGEIISADSRQVYRELNIGTGKLSKKEMCGVKHHLLDVAPFRKVYTVQNYVDDAKNAITKIANDGKIPIMCGGTGLYIDTLLEAKSIPNVTPNHKLRGELSKISENELYLILKEKDRRRSKSIDKKNKVRLIRALEIVEALGRVPLQKKGCVYEVLYIGINPADLETRIHVRLKSRLQAGMLEEGRNLHQRGLTYKRMISLGLEYKYMALHMSGRLSRAEMESKLEKAINQYAKRQLTWFRRNKKISWIRNENQAIKLVKNFLSN